MLMKEEGILLADSGFRNVSGRCGDAVYESRAAGFRHADMSQQHNVFRFPEDTCLPARRRPVYSVIITLGLDGLRAEPAGGAGTADEFRRCGCLGVFLGTHAGHALPQARL